KVNCSALRGKESVTLQGDGRRGTFKKAVDQELFRHPWEPDPQHQAKANMAKLAGKSGRLRVEGCLMRPGGAELAQNKAAPTNNSDGGDGSNGGLNLAGADPPEPINEYGQICADRLGALPAFDCLDETLFKVMPITQTDASGKVTEPDKKVQT